MESPSRFELEAAVQQWRQRLSVEPSVTTDTLAELEEHLRSSMDALQTRGLSPQEAFQIAAQRLGEPTALASEFSQVDLAALWKRRVFWMAVGCLLLELWNSISGLGVTLSTLAFAAPPSGVQLGSSVIHSNYLLLIGVRGILWILLLFGAIQLAKGRGNSLVERLAIVISNRTRFVVGVILLGGILSVAQNLILIRASGGATYGFWTPLPLLVMFGMRMLYQLPLGLLIAWLAPPRPPARFEATTANA